MGLSEDLIQFVEESLLRGQQKITRSDSLIDRGIIDSIGLMQLMAFLEQRTGIRIPDQHVTPDNFQSVEAMERLLEKLKK